MKLYVLDNLGGRTWREMLPPFDFVEEVIREEPLRLQTVNGNLLESKSVLLLHGGLEDRLIQYLKTYNLWVIKVSLQPGTGLGPHSSIYERKCPVNKGNDLTFKQCFADFWANLQHTGIPRWELLEPKPWPEYLVAIYLLLKAIENAKPEERQKIIEGWRQMDSGWKEEIWKAARREFAEERKGNVESWKEAGLPLFSEGGTSSPGSVDFQAVKVHKALSAIQIVLQESQQ